MRIGIAGAGGLGSNVAVNLVRTGITSIKIVDFDEIEESNLNRQFYFKDQVGQKKVNALYENLKRINPELDIITINRKLDRKNIHNIFSDCDIIVEAFDKNIYKSMIVEELLTKKMLIVSGNGVADNDLERIETKKLKDNLFVVGDFDKGIDRFGTFSTKVSIIAAIMANIVLKEGGFYARSY